MSTSISNTTVTTLSRNGPLDLSEIRQQIFSFLPSRPDLARCSLVSRDWYLDGQLFLWSIVGGSMGGFGWKSSIAQSNDDKAVDKGKDVASGEKKDGQGSGDGDADETEDAMQIRLITRNRHWFQQLHILSCKDHHLLSKLWPQFFKAPVTIQTMESCVVRSRGFSPSGFPHLVHLSFSYYTASSLETLVWPMVKCLSPQLESLEMIGKISCLHGGTLSYGIPRLPAVYLWQLFQALPNAKRLQVLKVNELWVGQLRDADMVKKWDGSEHQILDVPGKQFGLIELESLSSNGAKDEKSELIQIRTYAKKVVSADASTSATTATNNSEAANTTTNTTSNNENHNHSSNEDSQSKTTAGGITATPILSEFWFPSLHTVHIGHLASPTHLQTDLNRMERDLAILLSPRIQTVKARISSLIPALAFCTQLNQARCRKLEHLWLQVMSNDVDGAHVDAATYTRHEDDVDDEEEDEDGEDYVERSTRYGDDYMACNLEECKLLPRITLEGPIGKNSMRDIEGHYGVLTDLEIREYTSEWGTIPKRLIKIPTAVVRSALKSCWSLKRLVIWPKVFGRDFLEESGRNWTCKGLKELRLLNVVDEEMKDDKDRKKDASKEEESETGANGAKAGNVDIANDSNDPKPVESIQSKSELESDIDNTLIRWIWMCSVFQKLEIFELVHHHKFFSLGHEKLSVAREIEYLVSMYPVAMDKNLVGRDLNKIQFNFEGDPVEKLRNWFQPLDETNCQWPKLKTIILVPNHQNQVVADALKMTRPLLRVEWAEAEEFKN